jgi:hypothetical protein
VDQTGRLEALTQRLDRAYAEILQEVRVAQTGVQCLLAFVLTLAFTPRFGALTGGERGLYVGTLILAAVAASVLMAPAAFNRLLFRRQMRRSLVVAANRAAMLGLTLLLASMGCAIMLILRVVLGSPWLAVAITATVMAWCVLIWFAFPTWWRYRHRDCGPRRARRPQHGTDAAARPAVPGTAVIPAVVLAYPRRRRVVRAVEMGWVVDPRDGRPRPAWRVVSAHKDPARREVAGRSLPRDVAAA